MKSKINFILVFFFTFTFLLFLRPIDNGDFFHHLNTGRYIVTNWKLPYTDDLSFTATGKPWVAYAWGSGVLYYLIYQAFGWHGISAFSAFLGFLTLIFSFLLLKHLRIKTSFALLTLSLGVQIMVLRWPTRPEVLAIVFLSFLLYLLEARKNLFLLLLVFWLWGIMYGSSTFIGIIILILYLSTNKLLKPPYFLLLATCLLTSILNGYGLQSFLYFMQIPDIGTHTIEWAPLLHLLDRTRPNLVLHFQYDILLYLGFTLVFVLILILFFLKSRKQKSLFPWFYFFLSLTVFLPFYSNRFIALSALSSLPFLGIALSSLSHLYQKKSFMLFLILILVGMSIQLKKPSIGLGLAESHFPVDAVEFLKNHDIHGKIFVNQEFGAYLSWQLPHSKVFVDTRDDLYQPLGVFDDLYRLYAGELTVLEKYATDIAIVDVADGKGFQPLLYNPKWNIVYLTDRFFIAVTSQIKDRYQLPSFSAVDPYRSPPAKGNMLAQAEKEYIEILKNDPKDIESYLRLAEIYLAQNKPKEAKRIAYMIDITNEQNKLSPTNRLRILTLQGRVYLANHDCQKAQTSLREAESLSRHRLIFFPSDRLLTSVDRHLGEYFLVCEEDFALAKSYLEHYLTLAPEPLEKREIEKLLQNLAPTKRLK